MILDSLPTGPLQVNCYIIGCERTRKAAVVDPGGDAEQILRLLHYHDLRLQLVINTHGHFDHVGGNRQLLEATGAELLIHRADTALLTRAAAQAANFGLSAEISPAPQRELVGGEREHCFDVGLVGRLDLFRCDVHGLAPVDGSLNEIWPDSALRRFNWCVATIRILVLSL